MKETSEKRLLTLILALFILLGFTYALVTPVFEASDELWHYPLVRHLADGNPLPVQVFDPAEVGPWKQEASQPPLYYYVGAALTWWIDTGDMAQVRRLNPHVDNGVITPDGNINLVVHDPALDSGQGTLLAVRIVRLASVLMSAVTVFFTYRIAKAVAPHRPEIALGAAALIAFLPMFLFISGSVNNDNLAIMLAAVAVWLMIFLVQRPITGRNHDPWLVILLGVIIGLAVLTKEGTLALIPLAWGTLFVRYYAVDAPAERSAPAGDLSTFFRRVGRALGWSLAGFTLLMLPVLAIAGWWYYRNIVLYGDWLGWNAFIAVLGQRPQPATLAQLWGERHGFLMSYWGLFGGVNVPMWSPIYTLLNGMLLVSVVGFGVFVVKEARTWTLWSARRPAGFLSRMLDLVIRYFPLVVCLIFSAAVIYGLIDWATITWSSQGRLVFTALPTLTLLMVVGLVGWAPSSFARPVILALALLMFLVAAAAPFLWIKPAYDPATYYPERVFTWRPAATAYDQQIRLNRYSLEPEHRGTNTVRPGEFVDVVLEWEVLSIMENDWSVFVHLNDPVLDVPMAQRDMYHGQGLRPTRLLEAGETYITYYRLQIPETVVAPATLDLVVGLYDFETNERLPHQGGGDTARLSFLVVEPVPGETPNPLQVNFGNEIEIVGYAVDPRRARPGETINLTLYWRPLAALAEDYTFFAQVLDEDTTRWASADIAPASGTSNAPPGEVQALEMPLVLDEATPAGVFPLNIGLYTRTPDGGFQNRQIVVEGRITMDDFLTLTKIRVE
jgi:hypothetical protein